MKNPTNIEDWSKEHLLAYIRKLESTQAKASRSRLPAYPQPQRKPTREQKAFNFSAHPTRKIALKFSYDGEHYNGLAAQTDVTPLPTVEEVLWGALTFVRLVDAKAGFEGCGWEKCGRTDAGVSSAGQVVSFWIRSALRKDEPTQPNPPSEVATHEAGASSSSKQDASRENPVNDSLLDGDFGGLSTWDEPPSNTNITSSTSTAPPPPITQLSDADELKYIDKLNNVLPSTIRILAWSPVAPDFSARFACKYRHYKYFFTSRGLDIDAMRDGAARLVGEHDFRNMCKIDPSKQITNYRREILRAEITRVSGLPSASQSSAQTPLNATSSSPEDLTITHGPGEVYVLDLLGRAFLYNQVRHIMAVLLLIGSGLESPSLVSALLNVDPEHPYPPFHPNEPPPPIVPTKPLYQMADPLPLVLWDCVYGDGDVRWRIDGEHINVYTPNAPTQAAPRPPPTSSVFAHQRATYERSLIRASLDHHFLLAASRHHAPPLPLSPSAIPSGAVFGIPLGGGKEKRGAKYVPVLERERLEPVEVLNARWMAGKGARKAAAAKEANQDSLETTGEPQIAIGSGDE